MDYMSPLWKDPFAIWHQNRQVCTTWFWDGHTENHQWVDKTTNNNAPWTSWTPNPPATEREDINYMSRIYVPKNMGLIRFIREMRRSILQYKQKNSRTPKERYA